MLLVRLNSASSTINVLSIPRDLQVTIPGFGIAKINSAYRTAGQPADQDDPRERLPNLKVNHIVDVNFGGFTDLVNAIGCVYSDVDHRYYNNTPTPTTRASTPARLPEAVRDPAPWSSCASATPTPTSPATRASRTSSAGQGPVRHRPAVQQPRTAPAHLRQARPDRQGPALHRRADRPVRPRAQLGGKHDPPVHLPGGVRAVQQRPRPGATPQACYRDGQHRR